MKKLLISTALILLSAITVFGQTCEWAEKIGGNDLSYINGMTIDNYGNIYVAGESFSDTLKFNNDKSIIKIGYKIIFIAKYNIKGDCLWAESITGNNDNYVLSITNDTKGNVIVAGYFSSTTLNFNNGKTLSNSGHEDGYFAKYDSNGTCQMVEKIASMYNENLNSIKIDVIGNIYATGVFLTDTLKFDDKTIFVNKGAQDIYIAKFNENGKFQWAKQVAGNGSDLVNNIVVDNDKNFYLAGYFMSDSINFNNEKTLYKKKGTDIFIAKYNEEGNCLWAENIAGDDNDYDNGLAVDEFGNIYTAGTFNSPILEFNNGHNLIQSNSQEGFISKYNSSGKCQWAEKIWGNKGVNSENIFIGKNKNVYVVGGFSSDTVYFNNSFSILNNGKSDIYLAKYNSEGLCSWVTGISGNDIDNGKSIFADEDNNIYISGDYWSKKLIFDNGKSLTNSGNGCEAFISKYNQNNTSISDEALQINISVYPNPALDYIEINPDAINPTLKRGVDEVLDIQIFNTLGEVMISVEQTSPSVHRINVSNLVPGMYFIKIGDRVEKFIKI